MTPQKQAALARRFRQLHQGPDLLILPNIWDPLGALMLESLGYPAVATASAAVSYSRGHDDGEHLPLDDMVDAVARIAAAVRVPVSADIERGYGDAPEQAADTARRVVAAGAVGINIEDSFREGGPLRPAGEQAARIRAIRAVSEEEGIPLFINARIDVFLRHGEVPEQAHLTEAIDRGRAYVEAGADGLYPIGAGRRETLSAFAAAVPVPVNVYLRPGVPSAAVLREIGIRRLSAGPNLLRVALEAMRRASVSLRDGEEDGLFGPDVISSDEIARLIRRARGRPGGDEPAG